MIASRPLTIADIFDRAVTVVVRNLRAFLALCAISATSEAFVVAWTHSDASTGWPFVASLGLGALVWSLTFSGLVRLAGDPAAANESLAMLLRTARRDYLRSLGSLLLIYLVTVLVLALVAVVLVVLAALVASIGALNPRIAIAVVGLPAGLVLFPPLLVITSVAYASTILERTGSWRGIVSATSRCVRAGVARTWLLGAATAVIALGPSLALSVAVEPLAQRPGMWWLLLPNPYLTAIASSFATAVTALAAVDYRNRREGADLQAALDTVTT